MSTGEATGRGTYRLFKQGGGRTAFAQVHVELRPYRGDDDIVVSVALEDSDSTTPERDPEWFEAAVDGCRHALALLKDQGIETDQQVAITRLLTSLVDTRSDAVWTAAAMATAEALGANDELHVVFRNRWTVESTGQEA